MIDETTWRGDDNIWTETKLGFLDFERKTSDGQTELDVGERCELDGDCVILDGQFKGWHQDDDARLRPSLGGRGDARGLGR